jgi:uncharacterized membrane-anchored protein
MFLPKWRFFLPLSLQILIILGLPAQAIYTYYTGKTVVLQTMPVDPYDLLRGYSQTLSYDISRISDLEKLSGWNTLNKNKNESNLTDGTKLYVILEAPQVSASVSKPPQPWKAVAVSRERPKNLPSDRIALEGIYRYSSIDYGLERYYLPENRVKDINREIGQLQINSASKRPFVVEVKVNSQGNAVPASLWIGDRNYRF